MRRNAILVNVILLLCCALTLHARGNMTVPLKFTPQEGVHSNNPTLPSAMLSTTVAIRVEDARKLEDPLLIGRGTGGDDKVFLIHADKSVVGFIQEVFADTLRNWGFRIDAAAPRTLILQITRFDLDESNKAVGSVYGAEINLAYVLRDGHDAVLTQGTTSTSAHRYGRSHSLANCNEVLSDSLKEAFANVLSDADVQSKWTSTKASAPAESVEERLRKLDDLLKRGLITKDEYDKKRAEILKGL